MEGFIAEVVVAVLGVVMFYARKWFLARVSPRQIATLMELARAVVAASEKVGQATAIPGPEKYELAEQSLTTLARRVGTRLKPEEANAFIHAALIEADAYSAIDLPAAEAA